MSTAVSKKDTKLKCGQSLSDFVSWNQKQLEVLERKTVNHGSEVRRAIQEGNMRSMVGEFIFESFVFNPKSSNGVGRVEKGDAGGAGVASILTNKYDFGEMSSKIIDANKEGCMRLYKIINEGATESEESEFAQLEKMTQKTTLLALLRDMPVDKGMHREAELQSQVKQYEKHKEAHYKVFLVEEAKKRESVRLAGYDFIGACDDSLQEI